MVPSIVLTLREGLEAALIIGIVLGALNKFNRTELKPVVWWGAASAAGVSVLVAIIFQLLGVAFVGEGEAIFEGITMLLAAGVLTWMIFWMAKHSRNLSTSLESEVRQATAQQGKRALFLVAFLAVVREGIELALFLTATSLTAGGLVTLVGAAIGLAASVVLARLLFASLIKLNLRRFFLITNILLIVFAAGLVAYGVHELNEAMIIPAIIEHVWDINWLLDENSFVGSLMKVLFGYNGNPSLTEVLAYITYCVVVVSALFRSQVAGTSVSSTTTSTQAG
ncbi:MAG: FTR1 family protein [Anaerolineales bacterium]|nr:FTR1 family protein [Anaerolineales bacterium]